MNRGERRRELRRQRAMGVRKVAYAKRAKVLARKRELRERLRLRLTPGQKLTAFLKLIIYIVGYPIWIWLPDKHESIGKRR